MITLKSSDEQTFEIEETTANGSETIKHIIEDNCANSAIPLPIVTSKILSKVIEYLEKHESEKEALEAFDKEFVKVDKKTLYDLTLAAHYLDIKGLLDLSCKAIAEEKSTSSEICKIFNIKYDFKPEEEEDVVWKKNEWVFEKLFNDSLSF